MSEYLLIQRSVRLSRWREVRERDALILSVKPFVYLLLFGRTPVGARGFRRFGLRGRFSRDCSQRRINATEVQEVDEPCGLTGRLLLHPFELSVPAKLQLLFGGLTQLRHLVLPLLLQALDLSLQLQDLLQTAGLILEEERSGERFIRCQIRQKYHLLFCKLKRRGFLSKLTGLSSVSSPSSAAAAAAAAGSQLPPPVHLSDRAAQFLGDFPELGYPSPELGSAPLGVQLTCDIKPGLLSPS